MSEQINDINKLQLMLEEAQVKHAKELSALRQETLHDVDQSIYDQKRKRITDLYQAVSETLQQSIQETRETTRKQLADQLLGAESNSDADLQHYRDCINLIEKAGNDSKKIDELVHRALRWQDKTLARLLARQYCGTKDRQTMHQLLAGIDERVKATYDFEVNHGAMRKDTRPSTWAGWRTYGKHELVDIPGRPPELQPAYLRAKKQEQLNKHAGRK